MDNGRAFLNRYTTLPVLLDMLKRKKLVLNDPSHWEDKNDVELISEYKERKRVRRVFVICFCIERETNLCWSAYAGGVSGCCVEFDRPALLKKFPQGKPVMGGRFRRHRVIYKHLSDAEGGARYPTDDFPFIKRHAYRGESEYRILWEGRTDDKTMDVDIDLNSINRITLNYHMPSGLYESTKELIQSIGGRIKVHHSTLYRNRRWIDAFRNM